MKYMRRTAGYTWTDYKTNAQIAKELKITPILDKLLEYKRSWIQYVNRMPRNGLPRVMKYAPQLAEGIMVDLWRDVWIRETGTGQQVAQLHERYMMMMMMMMMTMTTGKVKVVLQSNKHYFALKIFINNSLLCICVTVRVVVWPDNHLNQWFSKWNIWFPMGHRRMTAN